MEVKLNENTNTNAIPNNNKFNQIIDFYEITKLDCFLENFSLQQVLEDTLQNIKDFTNNIITLVNTKNCLYKDCTWNMNTGNKYASPIENFNSCRYIATEITLLIDTLLSKNSLSAYLKSNLTTLVPIPEENKIYSNFQVYSFGKSYERESLYKFERLRISLLKKSMTTRESDLLPQLSQIFNEFYNSIISRNELKKKEFLRIVVFLGSQENLLDSNKLKTLIKTYSKQFSITFNFILLENDFSLTKNSLTDFEYLTEFTKEEDIQIVDERFKFIIETLNEKESKLKEISKLLYKEGRDLLNDNDLKDFINKFDSIIKEFNFLYLDITRKLSRNSPNLKAVRETKVCEVFFNSTSQELKKYSKVINSVKDKLSKIEVYKEMIKNEEKDINDKSKLLF